MKTVSIRSQAEAVRKAAGRAAIIGRELGLRNGAQVDLLREHLDAAAQTLEDIANAERAVEDRLRRRLR